jgi:predicted ATPase
MITSWKVSNFKSIRDGDDLPLGPLTIFAGANSSGKSTFIQSILLVAQTLSNKVGSRSVVLNGALTSLGQFDDLKSLGSEADQIVIKCICRPLSDADGLALGGGPSLPSRRGFYYGRRSMGLREVSFEIAFDADPSHPERDVFQIQPRLFSSALDCTLRDEDNVDQRYSIFVRHIGSESSAQKIGLLEDSPDADEYLRAGLAYDVTLDEMSMSEVREEAHSARPVGCVLRHFLPARVLHTVDPIQEEARAITAILQSSRFVRPSALTARPWRTRDVLLSGEILQILKEILGKEGIDLEGVIAARTHQASLFGPDDTGIPLDLWQEILRSLSREERLKAQQALQDAEDLLGRIAEVLKKSASSTDTQTVIVPYGPRHILESSRYLDELFATSVKYLGPLRDAPKPLYPLAPSADPYDIGLRGENTASVLEQHKSRRVRYIPSAHFKSSSIERRTANRTLEAAVVDWLQYLGIASSVESKDMGKLGHELKVALANSEGKHDLTHVGVGVSQVLPILVMCLLAETDSTLVFEQPELHLHPKVQTLLGDFFLSMALCNKQCIVETHSEYLIDRLRFRIAAAEGNVLTDQAKIYFVEKPGAASTFRQVTINEYGAIVDWPDGFFDQSQQQAEEILKAAALKRKVTRNKGDA